MAVNWKRLLTWTIGLLLLVALVFFFVDMIRGPPPITDLMLGTMALRSTNDTVQRAELITRMDAMVKELENDAIAAQWSTLAGCIAGNACTQDDYFDFLLMIAIEKREDIPNAELIANVITVNRYWDNAEKIIEFSKALTETNEQVEALQLKTIANEWQEIIYCDGKCQNYHDLFFEFIRLLLSV
jgi:hypothetical protein